MKKIVCLLGLALATAGCYSQPNQGALTGAAAGAALGAAVSGDDDRTTGALVGGALGAAAGNYIGRTNNGQCLYRDSYGNQYTAACR